MPHFIMLSSSLKTEEFQRKTCIHLTRSKSNHLAPLCIHEDTGVPLMSLAPNSKVQQSGLFPAEVVDQLAAKGRPTQSGFETRCPPRSPPRKRALGLILS